MVCTKPVFHSLGLGLCLRTPEMTITSCIWSELAVVEKAAWMVFSWGKQKHPGFSTSRNQPPAPCNSLLFVPRRHVFRLLFCAQLTSHALTGIPVIKQPGHTINMPRQFPWTKCQTPCAPSKLKLSLDFVATTNTDSTPTLLLLNTQHRIHKMS